MNWHLLFEILLFLAAIAVLPKLFYLRVKAQGRWPGWPFVGIALVGVAFAALATV